MAKPLDQSGHDDMIHDAVLDYYGRRLATCSSDKTIKIFELDGDKQTLQETLRGHEAPIFSLSFSPPRHGTLLASSSYDGHVHIYRELPPPASNPTAAPQWQLVHQSLIHTASVNSIAWSPADLGCLLACASTDGNVSVLEFINNQWQQVVFQAHGPGVNAVSWAPSAALPGSIARKDGAQQNLSTRRLATAGCDNAVKIWQADPSSPSQTYTHLATLPSGHADWVRDVAWSPTLLSKTYIASASQDKTVRIWTSTNPSDMNSWQLAKVLEFGDQICWRVSWSLSGNILAVSSGDGRVTLWRENLRGEWDCIKEVTE